jgi:hypothetical protein
VFNSVIFHQLSDNPNLLYGILTAHKTFQELGTFTLAQALREIKRTELAREEQAAQLERNRKGLGHQEDDLERGDLHAEKVRLLQQQDGTLDREAESSHDSNMEGEEESTVSCPIVLQSSESTPGTPTTEKARGKMRERRPHSLDENSNADGAVSTGIGRNGFVPTQEWVSLLVVTQLALNTSVLGDFLATRVSFDFFDSCFPS